MKRLSTLLLGFCVLTWATGCCCGRYNRCVGWDACYGSPCDSFGGGCGGCGGCGGGGGPQVPCCGQADGGHPGMTGQTFGGGGCQSGNCGSQTFGGNQFDANSTWSSQMAPMMAPGEPIQAPPVNFNPSQGTPAPSGPPTPITPPKN